MQSEYDAKLAGMIAELKDDPLRFVRFCWEWGQGKLAGMDGPDEWQARVLNDLRDAIQARRDGAEQGAIREAVASGHGVGKTALVAWVIHWFISTRPHPQVVCTANTETQLTTKTWRELAKWRDLALNGHWFEHTATRYVLKASPATWFASAIPWSEHRSEAFAGAHEAHVLYVFDEASAIADSIWEVSEGAMTTPGAMWLAFGNPTQNTGRFRECWGRFRHRWRTQQVDSRTAKMADQGQIAQWIADYGEDSDFVRVRVKGEFPRQGDTQFIPSDLVDKAKAYKAEGFEHFPVLLGVDVARFGDDASVILARQGRKVHQLYKFRGLALTDLASRVYEKAHEHKAKAIFIDGVGVGGGVVDICRQLGLQVFDINGGSEPSDKLLYRNKRAEMWGNVRDWLRAGAELPDDVDLASDLISVQYGYTPLNQILLEKKEDMKKRGLASPDCADALALTFAHPIAVDEPMDVYERRLFHTADTNSNPWAA